MYPGLLSYLAQGLATPQLPPNAQSAPQSGPADQFAAGMNPGLNMPQTSKEMGNDNPWASAASNANMQHQLLAQGLQKAMSMLSQPQQAPQRPRMSLPQALQMTQFNPVRF